MSGGTAGLAIQVSASGVSAHILGVSPGKHNVGTIGTRFTADHLVRPVLFRECDSQRPDPLLVIIGCTAWSGRDGDR
jgi:hypothetical protein